MRKISGYLSILGDSESKSVTVSDTFEITGDIVLTHMLIMELAMKQKSKDAIGPIHYLPQGDYNKDLTAIMLMAELMLDDMELEGDWPEIEGGDVIFNEA
ncbi:hypothetical protein [Bacillus toyonensis]|uniref:hypothetical protein n=1 Tax=Bacillus toyonensis TaxID=155322 RepID=UPI000BED30A7|nr:hypothetical protein [Bacillus toyonensis]PED95750.1 hypothetical protein CON90_05705 [Bacillus toyonensis]PFS15027.1 hypothetical protein COK55_12230 [Bacillus cereus]PGE39484.1 hypothetical protein COM60_11280 [Bacillus toyonensis]